MPRSLIDMIRLYTGCDATTEPVFELANNLPCSRCGTVTLTALLIDGEDDTITRTCIDCCHAWQ